MIFSSAVPPGAPGGAALSEYLAKRFTYHGRGEWEAIAVKGMVTVNGRAAGSADRVFPGDIVAYDAGDFEEPAADLSYRIVFEDEWLIGIDKPGNLLVHRGGRSFRSNLMYQLRFVHDPPYPQAHPCHRLDRGTSGVVCVAKNAAVRASLGRSFAGGVVEKTYLAVARGAPAPGKIDYPLSKTEGSALSCRHGVSEHGKEACTLITAVTPLGAAHSLVTVRPLTGRTHQIRIHLAAAGAPVVGDRLYGDVRDAFTRHALHCASLRFAHPVTGRECLMEAQLPADMRELVERFSGA